MKDLHEMASRARNAFYTVSVSSHNKRNEALTALASVLEKKKQAIFDANRADLEDAAASDLAAPLLHRLAFGEEKLAQVIRGLHALCGLADPIGRTLLSTELTEGLSSLCIKSGNAVLLKGGREALRTNQALCDCVRQSLEEVSLPADTAQLLETREDVAQMLKEDALIDLIIPRGSNSFVRYIMDNSRIPVLGHSDGICHVYIDRDADLQTALKIALDSKTQNVSVCNAMETLLVHRDIAARFLPEAAALFRDAGVEIRGDEETRALISCLSASEEDWKTEYLDYIVSIRIVSTPEEAIGHINRYGSHHTDAVVTKNEETASSFMNRVDSAGVYWNVSTRFADGFVYGLGAEVGIATGKLHARGPMGLEGLTTYKYKLIGSGQTMKEVKDGTITYTHRPLQENCPF